jgi:ketosteroid isomerase-like protein
MNKNLAQVVSLRSILGLMLWAFPYSCSAAEMPPLNRSEEELTHLELRALKIIYEDAVNSGDLKPLEPYFTPETTGVVSLGKEFKNLSEFQKLFDDFKALIGPDHVYKIELHPERSTILGDIALARGTSSEYIKTSKGKEFNLTTLWSATLRRENGKWHLLRCQVTLDPFDNSVFHYFIMQTKKVYGWGALFLGLIVGALVVMLLRRKPSAS